MSKSKSNIKKTTNIVNEPKPKKVNLDHENEPFSFHTENTSSTAEKDQKHLLFNNFFKSRIIDDLNTAINNCANSTSSSISNTLNAGNARSKLTEKILSKLSSSVSDTLEQNIAISQDLLKCKDAKDTIEFQRKVFKSNFSNILNLYMNFTESIQEFVEQNIKISSDYLNSSAKSFAKKSD